MKKSSFYKIYYSLLIVLCIIEVTFSSLGIWPIERHKDMPVSILTPRLLVITSSSSATTTSEFPDYCMDCGPTRVYSSISFDYIHGSTATTTQMGPLFDLVSFDKIHDYIYELKTCETLDYIRIGSNLLSDCMDNCAIMSAYYLSTYTNSKPENGSLMEKKCSACEMLFTTRSESCDKIFDCSKRSGEQFCSRCSENMFACDKKTCIPKRWKCDQIVDCLNGEDEKNCEFIDCTENEFRCANDRCINKTLYCNGVDDCGDRSDEKTCSKLTDSNSFDCQRLFIPSSWHCDGVVDCYNGLDEKNCPTAKNCTKNQFKCDNRKCIHVNSVCDGVEDCWDRSDEKNCDKTKCADNQFDCGDQCIPLQWRCDKRKDCLNLKDEMNCNIEMYRSYRLDSDLRCVEGTFPCADRSGCISNDFVCDKYPNCKDQSDEMNCPDRNDLL